MNVIKYLSKKIIFLKIMKIDTPTSLSTSLKHCECEEH